jgi:hypothetical protein
VVCRGVFAPGVEQRGAVRFEGNWSIGIRRLGKIAQGSALSPRYAARMKAGCGRHWLETRGGERVAEMRSGMTVRGFFPERTEN